MKTFLNVLYRRILYKIPLKLLLVLLVVFGILFVCSSNAEFYSFQNSVGFQYKRFSSVNGVLTIDNTMGGLFCFNYQKETGANPFAVMSDGTDSINIYGWDYAYCTDEAKVLTITNLISDNNYFYAWYYPNVIETIYPPYTSLQCQTEYNLIPINSVDQNYCTSNNLCPASGPSDCPNVGVSNVFINDLFHPGAFNIIMNIPDEIDWDYAYTNSGQNMNIDVVGYNVDYEKIDKIVQLQNYKPTSEDFQKIIGLLAPYTKIIVFFVFLFIVWAWIKKPFKSKKL